MCVTYRNCCGVVEGPNRIRLEAFIALFFRVQQLEVLVAQPLTVMCLLKMSHVLGEMTTNMSCCCLSTECNDPVVFGYFVRFLENECRCL